MRILMIRLLVNKYDRINYIIGCYSDIYCSSSHITFLIRPVLFIVQYFDCCVQHAALFKETYIINSIINSQPTTEWLKLLNHFCQCAHNVGTIFLK